MNVLKNQKGGMIEIIDFHYGIECSYYMSRKSKFPKGIQITGRRVYYLLFNLIYMS